MEAFEFVPPNGAPQRFAAVTDAQKAYAAAGFVGRIQKVSTPERGTAAWLRGTPFNAALIGFAHAAAEQVEDADGAIVDGDDALHPGWMSLYDDAEYAEAVAAWCATWTDNVALVRAEDGAGEAGMEADADAADDAEPDDGPAPDADDEEPDDGLDFTMGLGPQVAAPVPSTPAAPLRTVAAATMSAIAEARIDSNNRWLAELGVVRPPSPTTSAGFKLGTTVVDLGYENLATKRREWEDQPTIGEQAALVTRAVRDEEREDWTVKASSLRMLDDGTLVTSNGRVAMEPQGFAALISFLRTEAADQEDRANLNLPPRYTWSSPDAERKARQLATLEGSMPFVAHGLFPRAASAYLAMDPDIRAVAFNRQMRYCADRELVIRNRRTDGPTSRAGFAVVSTGYTAFDADMVATVLADGLERLGLGDMRGEALYNPETGRLRLDATLHAPADVQDFAAGDVFKTGLRLRSDDAGGGSIHGGGIAWWNECLNLIIIKQGKGDDLFRLVHKGAEAELDRALRAGLDSTSAALRHFAGQWGVLRETPVQGFSFRGETFANVEEAVRMLVQSRELDSVMARDVLCEYVLTAHAKQGGGDTLSSIIDAFTRAAHEALVAECVRERIEGAAGRLVPVLAHAAAEA